MERTSFFSSFRVISGAFPVILAILGVVIANLPISFTSDALPAPLLGLMPVYFWCLVRPDLMSPAWAFLVGFLADILGPGPPGIWATSFVISYGVVSRQRDAFAGLSGFGAILGFATAALIACVTDYAITCLFAKRLLPAGSEMAELFSSVVIYIPVAAFLGTIQRRFVGASLGDF